MKNTMMLPLLYTQNCKKIDWSTAYAQPLSDLPHLMCDVGSAGGPVSFYTSENTDYEYASELENIIRIKAPRFLAKHCLSVSFDGVLIITPEVKRVGKKIITVTSREFLIYDCTFNETFEKRFQFIRDFVDHCAEPKIRAVETVKVKSEDDLMLCEQQFVDEGAEGAILRYSRAAYTGGRCRYMLEAKSFTRKADFAVVDFKPGAGKYAGVPVFVCAIGNGHYFEVVAPGSLEEKREFILNAESYVGRNLRVRYLRMSGTPESYPLYPIADGFLEA